MSRVQLLGGAVVKTSSIFEAEQMRNMRFQHEGNSTTSFSYDPTHPDDKNMVTTKRTIYEPTYRLAPLVKPNTLAIKDIIDSVLEQHLTGKLRNSHG